MVSRGCATDRFGIFVLAVSITVFVGCDRPGTTEGPDRATFASPLAVTPFVTTALVPQQVGLAPALGVVCVGFPAVTTRFDLVVVNGDNDLFIQQVGFRLLDVSQFGGSPLLVSASDISARFGSTLIRGGAQRSFTFDPQFGCGTFPPRFLSVDVVLIDRNGSDHKSKVIVPTK